VPARHNGCVLRQLRLDQVDWLQAMLLARHEHGRLLLRREQLGLATIVAPEACSRCTKLLLKGLLAFA
jgi:hypothetical protein